MKKYKATGGCTAVDLYRNIVGSQAFEVEVLGKNRYEAIVAACEAGQALVLAENKSWGKCVIYSRVTNIREIGTA